MSAAARRSKASGQFGTRTFLHRAQGRETLRLGTLPETRGAMAKSLYLWPRTPALEVLGSSRFLNVFEKSSNLLVKNFTNLF